MDDVSQMLAALAGSERRVAMATLIATRGTTPKREGAKMLVGGGGLIQLHLAEHRLGGVNAESGRDRRAKQRR